jgi:hypothetical protein
MAVIRRIVVPLLGAAVVAGGIAAAAFAVVSALPQPTLGDRVGVGVLKVLLAHRGAGSRMTIGGTSLVSHCRQLKGGRTLVLLSDGAAFVIHGDHVYAWARHRSRIASLRHAPGLVQAAEADMAGSYGLYAHELAAQLGTGEHVLVLDGGTVYELVLASGSPRAELLVNRSTLRPTGVRFDSRRLSGYATLLRLHAVGPRAGC